MSATFRVVVLNTDGSGEVQTWDLEEARLIVRLQDLVGGDHKVVDVVRLTPTLDMWIGDESAIDGSEANPLATFVASMLGHAQPFFGPVVFTGGADEAGDELPLTAAQASQLVAVVS